MGVKGGVRCDDVVCYVGEVEVCLWVASPGSGDNLPQYRGHGTCLCVRGVPGGVGSEENAGYFKSWTSANTYCRSWLGGLQVDVGCRSGGGWGAEGTTGSTLQKSPTKRGEASMDLGTGQIICPAIGNAPAGQGIGVLPAILRFPLHHDGLICWRLGRLVVRGMRRSTVPEIAQPDRVLKPKTSCTLSRPTVAALRIIT